jgi:hypothetical protein
VSIVDVVSGIFVALSLGVLAFFLHKVAWLLAYKRRQRRLMEEAAARASAEQSRVLPEWEDFARRAWRTARGAEGGPDGLVKTVEAELGRRVEATEARLKIGPALIAAILENTAQTHTVLEIPLRDGTVAAARLRIHVPPVIEPESPPAKMFELDARSRYGFWRRALVFITGLADVVYSASHIAKMSQYTHVPVGTILRRMSLVVLLVAGIVLEVVIGLRASLEQYLAATVLPGARWSEDLPAAVRDNLASLLALGVWTAAVAGLYFGLFFFVRHKSKRHLVELERLKLEKRQRLAAIRARHLAVLTEWAEEHGRTLDRAVELTIRHVELHAKHHAARIRRRMCGAELFAVAKRIEEALFARLPEATGALQDRITTTRRSFRHALWPHTDEMRDVVEEAQWRQAWRSIELGMSELRLQQPDPDRVAAFWTELVLHVATFPEVLGPEILDALRKAYLAVVEDTVEGTEADMARVDRALVGLVQNLNHQLAAAGPLLEARVDLVNQRIAADVARFQAEIIRTREAARLEAMAFEI